MEVSYTGPVDYLRSVNLKREEVIRPKIMIIKALAPQGAPVKIFRFHPVHLISGVYVGS